MPNPAEDPVTPVEERLERRLLDSLSEVFRETDWAPPEGSILTDAVVVMAWAHGDGSRGRSHFFAAPSWTGEGLLRQALRHHVEWIDSEWDEEDVEGDGP